MCCALVLGLIQVAPNSIWDWGRGLLMGSFHESLGSGSFGGIGVMTFWPSGDGGRKS